jgi:hypothetical protein
LEPLLKVLATTASSHRISGVAWWRAREPSDISVEDILRSIGSIEDDSDEIAAADWPLLKEVVLSQRGRQSQFVPLANISLPLSIQPW